MKLTQKIGFFGAGRMATALARGMLDAKLCERDQLLASDLDQAQRERFEKETGAKTTARNEEIAAACDLAILAVKPAHVGEVLTVIHRPFGGKLLISLAAGVSIGSLEGGLQEQARIVRVMPNTPALVRCGASAYAIGPNVKPGDIQLTESILGAVGAVTHVPEKLLDAVTGLSGSGPAYIFLVIEALSDGGVEMGLPRPMATQLAAQTVMGAAKLVLETGQHPGALKDMVASPGGTTIEGLRVLEEDGVRGSFMKAVRAATEKSKHLGAAHH
ncbi:MAG: pyrroline-5-carboxylate reductase [Verrucomicrobiae bacterium]|nr:pyrroline-5-carboxylate reductase [Verrucomicrobiae bacterium]